MYKKNIWQISPSLKRHKIYLYTFCEYTCDEIFTKTVKCAIHSDRD